MYKQSLENTNQTETDKSSEEIVIEIVTYLEKGYTDDEANFNQTLLISH